MGIAFWLVFCCRAPASAQKIKIIVDQDARGPGTSDQQAILVFLQSEKFDVLGITTVSGDQWVKEETQHVLRLLEIAGRTDVPVYQGAEFPLINSKEESERWEASASSSTRVLDRQFQSQSFDRLRGCRITSRMLCRPCRRASRTFTPNPAPLRSSSFRWCTSIREKSCLWAGGPLTNFALALKLDPEVATLAKEFVLMGGGLYADKGAIDRAPSMLAANSTGGSIRKRRASFSALPGRR